MWQIISQEHAVNQLKTSLKEGRLAHAYLLVGPPHVGKGTLALNLAQGVNCLAAQDKPCGECLQCRRIAAHHHTDVRIIGLQQEGREGGPRKEIGIDEVRAVEHEANLKPYEGTYRVFIFDGAENMSEEASNALLKTLEEPPPQSLLILLTSQEGLLLPTIRSRCRRIELRPMPQEEVIRHLVTRCSVEAKEAEILARLSRGHVGWALAALEDATILQRRRTELERIVSLMGADVEQRFHAAADLASLFYRSRSEAQEVLYAWLDWWRDLLVVREGVEQSVYNMDWIDVLRDRAFHYSSRQIADFVRAILDTLRALDNNANARLSLEVLMLAIPDEGAKGQREEPSQAIDSMGEKTPLDVAPG